MKMSDYRICCDKCFEEIANISPSAARIWMNLCAIYQDKDDVLETSNDFPELRTLEKLGYLISTDTAELIQFKMLGMHKDCQIYFCMRATHE